METAHRSRPRRCGRGTNAQDLPAVIWPSNRHGARRASANFPRSQGRGLVIRIAEFRYPRARRRLRLLAAAPRRLEAEVGLEVLGGGLEARFADDPA